MKQESFVPGDCFGDHLNEYCCNQVQETTCNAAGEAL